MARTADVVRKLFQATTDPEVLNFATGSPANATIPREDICAFAQQILESETTGYRALQYNDPQGIEDLRRLVAEKLLPRRGIKDADPSKVMITQGGMETLTLNCHVFMDPGDVILVEEPSFTQAIETFELFEAKCVGIECDSQGIIMEDLEKKFEQYKPKIIYVIPSFQNPSGRTTPLERRKALAEFANAHDVILLEDDPYVELRYFGEDLPAIKSFDKKGNIVFCNSFSKIFSPGMRLGYLYAEEEIVSHLYDAKTATNSHVAVLNQMLAAEYLNSGKFDANIVKTREIYTHKAEVAAACIKKYFPEGSHFDRPDGGIFFWVQLPEGAMDTTEILEHRNEFKVSFGAGAGFFVNGKGHDCMRLSFGNFSDEQIDAGMHRLGDFIKATMK